MAPIFFYAFFFVLLWKLLFLTRRKKKNLPPSPPSLPIIGHLHLLKNPLHRSLARLHGPILLLHFGSRPVLVVSSPSAAEECFTANDLTFANRPRLVAGEHLGYDYTAISFASYGPHWRNLRRMAALEIFSAQRLSLLSGVRSEEVRSLLRQLAGNVPLRSAFRKVELKSRFFKMALNIVMRTVVGKRYDEGRAEDKEEAERFNEILREAFGLAGETHLGDFVPALGWLDLGRYERRLRAVREKGDAFLQILIEERRRRLKDDERSGGETARTRTIVDAMLSLQDTDPNYYTSDFMKGVIVAMLAAGTDTTAVTMEWAMSLLLNHPKALCTTQAEIDSLVPSGQLVEEDHLPRLPYLQAVIHETLRLYPSGPILLPHENAEDCTIGGYDVRKGTMLVVNAWCIQRDEQVWEDATEFKPERFLRDGGCNGGHRFIPFGAGRRRCPGEGLAMRAVGLALANLVQCFEWESVGGGEVDMTEGVSLTMPKAIPLEVMCKTREGMAHALEVA